MSQSEEAGDEEIIEPLICEFCGTYITEPDQSCPALDDGRCRP